LLEIKIYFEFTVIILLGFCPNEYDIFQLKIIKNKLAVAFILLEELSNRIIVLFYSKIHGKR